MSAPRPELAALLDAARAAPGLETLTVDEARDQMCVDAATLWGGPADLDGLDIDELVLPNGCALRRYRPRRPGAAAVLHLHGGGWVIGDLDTHAGYCAELARSSAASVFSLDYRRAPEHRAPAAALDAIDAFVWLHGEAGALGIDRERIAVAGDSAGGNLAAVVAQRAVTLGVPLAGQVLCYPVTSTAMDTESYRRFATDHFLTRAAMQWFIGHYLGERSAATAARDPLVSPLAADDLTGVAPALVVTAGLDPLRDEGRAYAAALVRAGVDVEFHEFAGMVHGFSLMRSITPANRTLVERVVAFLRRVTAPDRPSTPPAVPPRDDR